MGIKKKIFLLLLAVSIIPVLLLGLISINVLRQAIIQEAVHQLETIAVIRKNRIRNILSQYFENIHSFFGSSVFEKSLSDYDTHHSPSHAKKISGTFSLFNKLNSNFNQIVLVSPEGTVIASSDPKLIGTRNYNKESYDYGRNRENFEVSAVDRKNKSIFEYYSRPLFRTNRMMGVLIIECKIDSILALLNDHTGLGRTGETLMAERNKNGDALYLNTIRARPDLTTNLIISKTNKIIPINWALQKTNMVFLNGTDLNGRKVFAFTEYFSENDWGLVVKIDKSEIFSKMRYFEIVIFLVISSLILVVFFVASYFSRWITTPILELTKIITEFSEGRSLSKTNVITDDEIGRLSHSFNKLVDNLDTANAKLIHAKRLSDVGMFTSIVAHELRNPLAVITIALANIRKTIDITPVQESLENIEKKVNESNQIINDLLAFSKIRPPNLQPTDIHKLIKNCIALNIQKAQKPMIHISLTDETLEGIICEIDSFQIAEVINNLLSNAFDAISNEGRIEISSQYLNGHLQFGIKDTGIGINDIEKKKIFEPFFTTKIKGTGLGLIVCHEIIQQHKGTITIESELGKGTEVSFTIPCKMIT